MAFYQSAFSHGLISIVADTGEYLVLETQIQAHPAQEPKHVQ